MPDSPPPPIPPVSRSLGLLLGARYVYSACQLDLLFYLLRQLQVSAPADHGYDLFTKDLETVSQRRWTFQQLRTATAELGSRLFATEDDHAYQQQWLFQYVAFLKGRGCIRVAVTPGMHQLLLDLKATCSPGYLHTALQLTSRHAWQLYQLVIHWPDQVTSQDYPLEELKILLDLKDPRGKAPEQLRGISQFKARVLDVAARQLRAHTDRCLSYELLKQGRAFTGVRLTATPQPYPEPPLPFR